MKLKWFKLLFIELPLILFILLFTVVTISFLPAPTSNALLFMQYLQSHLTYIALPLMLYALFLLLFAVSSIQMSETYTHLPQKNAGWRTIKYAFALAILVIIAFPISFLTTGIYAFGHINYHILAYNTGHTSKDILTSPQAIADAIADAERLSISTIKPHTYKKDILLLYMKKKNGFYEDALLPSFPNALYKRSYLPDSSMVLINNQHLVISNMSLVDLAILSPALGKMIVENSLNDTIHKPLPTIEVLDRRDYMAFRKNHINNQVEKIEDILGKVDESIASISGYIASNEKSIITNERLKETAAAKRETVTCKTPAKCETAKKKYDKLMKQADNNIAKATTALKKNQAVLGTSINNKNNLSLSRNNIAATEKYTPHELGVFVPGNKIKMTLDDNPDRVFDAYLSTLTHEYFHYLSYSREEQKLDHFFEEALTEYFARRAVENYTGKSFDIGYPVSVRIISEMTKDISEKKLLDVYFSKEQKTLTTLLNTTYGKSFYARNANAFSTLSYLPFDQSLILANVIMEDIGGKQLSANDFDRNIQGLSITH